MNQNPHLQSVDIDGDGEREIIIAVGDGTNKGRIYEISPNGGSLVYTNRFVSDFRLHQRVLDIDGDGALERVFAGGETGIGQYGPIKVEEEE